MDDLEDLTRNNSLYDESSKSGSKTVEFLVRFLRIAYTTNDRELHFEHADHLIKLWMSGVKKLRFTIQHFVLEDFKAQLKRPQAQAVPPFGYTYLKFLGEFIIWNIYEPTSHNKEAANLLIQLFQKKEVDETTSYVVEQLNARIGLMGEEFQDEMKKHDPQLVRAIGLRSLIVTLKTVLAQVTSGRLKAFYSDSPHLGYEAQAQTVRQRYYLLVNIFNLDVGDGAAEEEIFSLRLDIIEKVILDKIPNLVRKETFEALKNIERASHLHFEGRYTKKLRRIIRLIETGENIALVQARDEKEQMIEKKVADLRRAFEAFINKINRAKTKEEISEIQADLPNYLAGSFRLDPFNFAEFAYQILEACLASKIDLTPHQELVREITSRQTEGPWGEARQKYSYVLELLYPHPTARSLQCDVDLAPKRPSNGTKQKPN